MKRITWTTLVALMVSMPFAAFGMNTAGTIRQIYTWADYTGGAFLIVLDSAHPQCPGGYWLQDSTTSRASSNILASALSAYHAKSRVLIYADETSDFRC